MSIADKIYAWRDSSLVQKVLSLMRRIGKPIGDALERALPRASEWLRRVLGPFNKRY